MRWAKHVTYMGEMRNAYKTLIGNTGGMRPLGRLRYRWKGSINLDLKEGGVE
jgi:hypothetical protein